MRRQLKNKKRHISFFFVCDGGVREDDKKGTTTQNKASVRKMTTTTPNLWTIPHRITASDWRDPSTYRPDLTPLFVLGGSGAEDPSNIWMTHTSDQGMAYHVIFHDEQATRCMLPTGCCSGNGRQDAFSLDGPFFCPFR